MQNAPFPLRNFPLSQDRITALWLSSALHESAVNHSEEGLGGGRKLSKPFSLFKLNTQNILLPGQVLYACGLRSGEVAGLGLAGGRILD